MNFLGIDTSNYTTSAALWQPSQKNMNTASKLLPVPMGAMGLRQSEAVFHHTQALHQMVNEVCQNQTPPCAVGVSVQPRREEGSYMPCFTVGKMVAHSIGGVLHIPVYEFSHQEGHIAAAALGAGCEQLLENPLIAFHVSGGTTEAVLVEPIKGGFACKKIAGSLDLKAGQAVDRVGGMLGLPFPAGKHLDPLALQGQLPQKPKGVFRGTDCCLSGIENQCKALLDKGTKQEDIARFCIESIYEAIAGMTRELQKQYGNLPLLYAGGVMSNSILQKKLHEAFGGYFAPPRFSSDNAAGVAYLASLKNEGKL